MLTLDEVYKKFGETCEAAQLLETELGNKLLVLRGLEEDLFASKDPKRAAQIVEDIDTSTCGKLITLLKKKSRVPDDLESLLCDALTERNRLSHSFYRQHNFRRNSEDGRTVMLADLELIHQTILKAYKAMLLLSGIDLDAVTSVPAPTRHLPI